MDRNYWEKIAQNYNAEIFDVFRNDKTGIIREAILEHSNNSKTVIDIGCAVGKWIPFLSVNFKKVIATDISAKNIELAKKNCKAFANVEYSRTDMSDSKLKISPVDFAVCINAILTGSLSKRTVFFKSLSKCVKKSGTLILVIPSLESSMYTSIIRHRWKVDQQLLKASSSTKAKAIKYENLQQGNVNIDNMPTKHYLREELILLLEQEGFNVTKIQKVEYSWKTEFVKPPRWLKEPLPWDWMCVAKKK
ncbi:MAG: class I SAM-dependent methyltransferase [Chitinophagaceae bacterium]|nr:class I SAM-dependent methyltransferase [Chitinophagaceae bacterium]